MMQRIKLVGYPSAFVVVGIISYTQKRRLRGRCVQAYSLAKNSKDGNRGRRVKYRTYSIPEPAQY